MFGPTRAYESVASTTVIATAQARNAVIVFLGRYHAQRAVETRAAVPHLERGEIGRQALGESWGCKHDPHAHFGKPTWSAEPRPVE